MDWLITIIRNTWLSPFVFAINTRNCKTIEKEHMLLRELEIREAVLESQFSLPDKAMLTKELNQMLIQQGPQV